MGIQAGWYDDGTGTATLRWWDGTGWTENTAPEPGGSASDGVQAARVESVVAAGSSVAAGSVPGERDDRHAAKKAVKAAAAEAKELQRQQRQHQKQVAAQNRHFDGDHAEWAAKVQDLEFMLQHAQQFRGDLSGDVLLKSDELHYVSIPGSLIEDRAGQRTFVGGSQGISIPIGTIGGRSIRYRVGKMKGHVVQAPSVATVIDQGTIAVTNRRIVFVGVKQTRECLFAKLVGYEHLDVGDTVISVSNRQKPTRLHYAAADSNEFQFGLSLALADFRGQTAQLVQELTSQLDAERAGEPRLAT